MIYKTPDDWLNDPHKKLLLFGMSGLGKTHISNMLHASGDWFHYSVDYRIASHYLREHITGDISFDNLQPLARYLGKPGDPDKGGIEFTEYMRRQLQHQQAEINTLLDTARFIPAAGDPKKHFICDTGGSICEVVNPDDTNDPVLKSLAENLLMVWIKGSDAHSAELAKRFDAAPKPMCYRAGFLHKIWREYLSDNTITAEKVDPDSFVRWAYSQALSQRQPRYAAMAKNWGITVTAQDVANATTPRAFDEMIARTLENHTP